MSSDHKELSVEEGMAYYGLSPTPELAAAPKPVCGVDVAHNAFCCEKCNVTWCDGCAGEPHDCFEVVQRELRRLREKVVEAHAFMTATGIYQLRRRLECAAAMLKDALDGKPGS